MEPFTTQQGKAALLDWTDVNTDLIIPARYLKRIERTGYGPLLFADKRYLPGQAPPADDPEQAAAPDPAFPLNDPSNAGATILIVGKNFGCGSSREHAVWAVAQAGYRVLISPGKNEGFADIFEGNAYNNGLLPIEIPDADWDRLASARRADPGLAITVDLPSQTITAGPLAVPFDVPEAQKDRLLRGLDAIGETLLDADPITAYEDRSPAWAAGKATA
jgi:3-isopropylmalate/(R)-2-methylmalate dehydratase small subunit